MIAWFAGWGKARASEGPTQLGKFPQLGHRKCREPGFRLWALGSGLWASGFKVSRFKVSLDRA